MTHRLLRELLEVVRTAQREHRGRKPCVLILGPSDFSALRTLVIEQLEAGELVEDQNKSVYFYGLRVLQASVDCTPVVAWETPVLEDES